MIQNITDSLLIVHGHGVKYKGSVLYILSWNDQQHLHCANFNDGFHEIHQSEGNASFPAAFEQQTGDWLTLVWDATSSLTQWAVISVYLVLHYVHFDVLNSLKTMCAYSTWMKEPGRELVRSYWLCLRRVPSSVSMIWSL